MEVNFVDPTRRKGFRAKDAAPVYGRDSETYAAHRSRFDRWGALADCIEHIILIEVRSAKLVKTSAYDAGATEADLKAQWSATLLSD